MSVNKLIVILCVIISLVPALLLLCSAQESDYCAITPGHTLCRYQGPDQESCGEILAFGVDQTHIHDILHSHNEFRSLIATGSETRGAPGPQPSAANMKQLTWDWELAREAQRLAEQCKFQHDCPDCRTVNRFQVGQNLYQVWQNTVDDKIIWSDAVKAWYDEVDIFNSSIAAYYEFEYETGHYTQLVWANTEYVGCGYTYFLKNDLYHKLYVCNYGPTGNYITEPLYKIEAPCTECPGNTECSVLYKGLCAVKNDNSVLNNTLSTDIRLSRNLDGSESAPINLEELDYSSFPTQTSDFTTDTFSTDTTTTSNIDNEIDDYIFIISSVSASKLQNVLETFATLLTENQTLHYYQSGSIFANNDIWSKLCTISKNI